MGGGGVPVGAEGPYRLLGNELTIVVSPHDEVRDDVSEELP